MNNFDNFIINGWRIKTGNKEAFPNIIKERYPWASDCCLNNFISSFESLTNASDTSWFLSNIDFSGNSDSAFAWNEWEKISTDAADGDQYLAEKIKSFWDNHLPIFMSVRNGYSYYAVTRDLVFVKGCEPEFEDAIPVATNLEDFLDVILRNES